MHGRLGARRQVLALLIGSLFVTTVLGSAAAHAQTSTNYIQEFSEPGEQGTVDSTWTFLTHDGVQRTIEVYRYGNVLVAFDQTGVAPLSGVQAADFFQAYELRALVSSGQLSEASYFVAFQQSLACSVAVPDAGGEAGNAVVAQASDAIQKVLPDGASAIVGDLFAAGSDVGIVKDANPYVLALGAVCYGGDLIENYAASQLTSCATYVENLRNFETYEGMPGDLVGCHDAAISKLQLAQFSPNVLAQYGQTVVTNAGIEASNALGAAWCYLAQCQSVPQQLDQSVLDQVEAQITALKAVDPLLQSTSGLAQSDAQTASGRIQLKANEANQAIGQLSSQLTSVDSVLSMHEGLGAWADSFMSPQFDASDASANRSQAESYLGTASAFSQQYRYNSAIGAAQQGETFAAAASASLQYQDSIPRSLAPWVYYLALLVAILTIVGVAVWRDWV